MALWRRRGTTFLSDRRRCLLCRLCSPQHQGRARQSSALVSTRPFFAARSCIRAHAVPRAMCCHLSGACLISITPPSCDELATTWHRQLTCKSKICSAYRARRLSPLRKMAPASHDVALSGGLAFAWDLARFPSWGARFRAPCWEESSRGDDPRSVEYRVRLPKVWRDRECESLRREPARW